MTCLQLAQRGLEVVALGLELLDVRERLVVLLLGQRVDRAELLAPAREALDARAQLLGLLGARAPRSAGSAGEPEPLGERAELLVGLGGLVAHLLRADLGLR